MSGEHDLSTAPELRARLHDLGESSAVIIDLDETTFVDSSILGVLVGGLRRARERDVPFGLVLGEQRPSGDPPDLRADGTARRLPDLRLARRSPGGAERQGRPRDRPDGRCDARRAGRPRQHRRDPPDRLRASARRSAPIRARSATSSWPRPRPARTSCSTPTRAASAGTIELDAHAGGRRAAAARARPRGRDDAGPAGRGPRARAAADRGARRAR